MTTPIEIARLINEDIASDNRPSLTMNLDTKEFYVLGYNDAILAAWKMTRHTGQPTPEFMNACEYDIIPGGKVLIICMERSDFDIHNLYLVLSTPMYQDDNIDDFIEMFTNRIDSDIEQDHDTSWALDNKSMIGISVGMWPLKVYEFECTSGNGDIGTIGKLKQISPKKVVKLVINAVEQGIEIPVQPGLLVPGVQIRFPQR